MRAMRIKMAGFFLAVMTLIPPGAALAQDEPSFAPEVAPREETVTLLSLIKAGGITMIPLGLFSLAVVALTIRSFLVIKEEKLIPEDSVRDIIRKLAQRDVVAARAQCEEGSSLITSIVGAGLDRVTDETIDIEVIKEAIDESSTKQMLTYMAPVSYLSIIGAISPMLGLLGTVSGMIKAFQNIAAGGMGKAELLAANIGEALVTTATGLIIAIPAMLFYFFFKNRFMRILAAAGEVSGAMLDALRTGALPLRYRNPEPGTAGGDNPS